MKLNLDAHHTPHLLQQLIHLALVNHIDLILIILVLLNVLFVNLDPMLKSKLHTNPTDVGWSLLYIYSFDQFSEAFLIWPWAAGL